MVQLSRWKVFLLLAALVLGVVFAAPNLVPQSTLDRMPGWVPAKRLNLGLDLQGGSYLMYQVDTVALEKEKMTNLVEEVRSSLKTASIEAGNPDARGSVVTVRITDPARIDEAYKLLKALAVPVTGAVGRSTLDVRRVADQQIELERTPDAKRVEVTHAVDQTIEIVRRRIDQLGTREPLITRQGADRINIQAAGESDPEKLKAIIGKTAKLTFQMVDDTVSPAEAEAGRMPPGDEVLAYEEGGGQILVHRRAVVTGEMLTNASQDFHPQNGTPIVSFRFNGEGARKFGDATTQNIGKRFAIVLDQKVISAPTINGAITGGSGYIEGNFTVDSANNLAILLRAGALPAPLNVVDQRAVGAELGADAVRAGAISTMIGFAAIVVFMILSYGLLFGGISVLGLILNLTMLVAAMSFTQATLTLPGIAGMILTLAVAVDANVLIYERIRDEERSGHKPLAAMDVGFKRASVSIYDANVTTLISAAIMYFFGSGPVKGFAWTLAVGVITSVFTAMLVSQVLLGVWYKAAKPKKLPI